jgi:hypothetical protein
MPFDFADITKDVMGTIGGFNVVQYCIRNTIGCAATITILILILLTILLSDVDLISDGNILDKCYIYSRFGAAVWFTSLIMLYLNNEIIIQSNQKTKINKGIEDAFAPLDKRSKDNLVDSLVFEPPIRINSTSIGSLNNIDSNIQKR